MPLLNLLLIAPFLSTPLAQAGGGFDELDRRGGPSSGEFSPSGYYGHCMLSLEDRDGDGVLDFLIGDPWAVTQGVQGGVIEVVSGATGKTLMVQAGTQVDGYFGQNAVRTADFDIDGVDDFLVAAPRDPFGGAVYLYSGKDLRLLRKYASPYLNAGTRFGEHMAALDDVNGDGFAEFAVGIAEHGAGGIRSGSVVMISGSDGAVLSQYDGDQRQRLGEPVTRWRDHNGDGLADLLTVRSLQGGPGPGEILVLSGADLQLLDTMPTTWERAGNLVSVDDMDGDGIPEIAASSGYERDRHRGNIEVFSGASLTSIQRVNGKWVNRELGRSLASPGDWDGDGLGDLAFSYVENLNGSNERLHVVVQSSSTREPIATFRLPVQHSWHSQGIYSLGNHFGDGRSEIAVWNGRIGELRIYGHSDFIETSADEVSASTGGVVDFDLHFPVLAEGRYYRLLASMKGTGPIYYGTAIPLSLDATFMQTLRGNFGPVRTVDTFGRLDSRARASGRLVFRPGLFAPLVGRTIYLAAIAYPANKLPKASSASRTITIVP